MDIVIMGAKGSVKLHLPLCGSVDLTHWSLAMRPEARPMQEQTCKALLANAKVGLASGWGCQVIAEGVGLEFKQVEGRLWARGTASGALALVDLPSGVSCKLVSSKLLELSGPDKQSVGLAADRVSKAMPWRRAQKQGSRKGALKVVK